MLDAADRGCDLFDVAELRRDYSAEEFANMLMCEFVDDSASVFPLTMLQPCQVTAGWNGPASSAPSPCAGGDRVVRIGYDPAEAGDSARIVMVAPAQVPGGKLCVLAGA